MTFITQLEDSKLASQPGRALGLSQRGRAGLEMLGSLQRFSSAHLRPCAKRDFESDAAAIALIDEHAADKTGAQTRSRIARARTIADTQSLFRLERFIQRWVAEENFNFGIPAIEEKRAQFEAFNAEPPIARVGGTLELAEVQAPEYYDAEWHLEPGGWDGYDLYGPLFAFAVGPLVFARGGYAAVGVDDDIAQQRLDTVAQFPRRDYARIFEPGCGGGTTFRALNAVFPDAELVGCDLSPGLLTNGHRTIERLGVKAHLKQRDVLDTGEPDSSVDAVITYALHHELPPEVNGALFREMFRIMRPGADLVASDPPPFRRVDLFHAVILDWDTANRNEPFFSEVLHSDLEQQMRDAGFVGVESYPIGKDGYPWIMRGSKPAEAPVAAPVAAAA